MKIEIKEVFEEKEKEEAERNIKVREVDVEAKADAEPDADTEVDLKADAELELKSDIKEAAEAEIKSDSEKKVEPKAEVNSKLDFNGNDTIIISNKKSKQTKKNKKKEKLKQKAEAKAALKSLTNPEVEKIKVKSKTKIELNFEAGSEVKAKAEPKPKSKVDIKPKAKAEAEAEAKANSEVNSLYTAIIQMKEKHKWKYDRKYDGILILIAMFIIVLFITYAYTSLIDRQVSAIINGKEYSVDTKAYTIGEFLDEKNIVYSHKDYISMPPATYIYDGVSFRFKHAMDFTVKVDGKTKKCKTLKATVGEALEDNNIKVEALDIVSPGMGTELSDNIEIIINRVTTKDIVVEEKTHFKTIEKNDATLLEGQKKVENEGNDGRDKVTYRITYIDGVESSRSEITRETIDPVTDKTILKGTRINYNGVSYSKKLIVKAYAYTGGGRTALGTRARVGEIAVDPSVIPLGSNVYIEGVGARRAEDTGGNIKGNTIDIYMNTEAECGRWGVRYLTIYVQ